MKSKLKLQQCSKCFKTYAEAEASREDEICKTCMSKMDKKTIKQLKSVKKRSDEQNKYLEKLAPLYEEAYPTMKRI